MKAPESGSQRLARARDRSAHWMMREAIAQYLEREERREVYRQDGIRAWEEYQTTDLHLTEAEADAWLAELEAGGDAEPPECHACIWSAAACGDVTRLHRLLAEREHAVRAAWR